MEIYKVEKLIVDSLCKISQLVTNTEIESRLIMPKYRPSIKSKKGYRYSEQELKQLFIDNLINDSNLLYSVETPSQEQYRFKGNKPLVLLSNNNAIESYQSAMIDVSVYDTTRKLISHIEFKHGQCPIFPIQKDFLKLICESDYSSCNYFVHYLDKANKRTKETIFRKYKESLENIKKANNIKNLNERLEKVYIFVLFSQINESYSFSLLQVDNINTSEELNKFIKEVKK